MPRAANSTLFPYTTLFRSTKYPYEGTNVAKDVSTWMDWHHRYGHIRIRGLQHTLAQGLVDGLNIDENSPIIDCKRSEEHTSELQSRFDLVCRLLLEKKKKN